MNRSSNIRISPLVLLFSFLFSFISGAQQISTDDPVYDELVWSDEFEVDGPLDGNKWFHQTQLPNGSSWYNGEIQHYTNRTDNSFVENGVLKIVAKRELFTDQGQTKEFTSARLNSKFAFTNGRVEIRAKLPTGAGTWPALWMLGKNINEPGAYWQTQGYGTTNWPACGEIDIMEHWGTNQNYVSSALHTPSSYGATVNVGGQTIPTASTAFHVYSLDWYPDRMVFKIDGNTHYTYEPSVQDSDTWPFLEDQYIIFNVAMLPTVQPAFTQSAMEIDYIRVYRESSLSQSEQTLDTLKLFPNPTDGTLTLISDDITSQPINVFLYSLEGRLIRKFNWNTGIGRIDLNINDIPGGFYFMRYHSGNRSQVFKIIKK